MAIPFRRRAVRAVLGAALTLAAGAPALAQGAADQDAALSDGHGCAGAIARWQDFSARENQGGHMDSSVYSQIGDEIDRASRACQAGQDAQARRLVSESRCRHGY